MANAAKRSNVSLFVYSSVASGDQWTGITRLTANSHRGDNSRNWDALYDSTVDILHAELAMDAAGGRRRALSLPLDPATRLQMVAVDHIGGMVATALERLGKWQDRVIELARDEL